ncbi:putative major facilitator superfamily transporter [Phaeosphaeria sp. MPI-PUGE-AT-0046c]|nr:putative major facilitator superfamily transporter [Phaeosphaeria sp. MPI-PUGE-AT-0046c]
MLPSASTTRDSSNQTNQMELKVVNGSQSAACSAANKASSPQAMSELPWSPTKQVKLIVAGLASVIIVVGLDMTIFTVAPPTVANALQADATKAFWFAAIYLLTNAVVQPLMAAWADIFGRQATYFSAVLLFTIGTIVCCTARNVAAMMAGRAIQGLGGGGIISVQLIILSDIIPLRQLPKYMGQCQLATGIGTCLAPIVGGALIKSSWRWLFYINLPFCAIGLAIPPLLFRYEMPLTTLYDKLSSIDWLGSATFVVGTTSFLLGVSWGGNQYVWDSVPTLVPLLVGLATVAMTAVYERFVAKKPFLHFSIFNRVSSLLCSVCAVLQALIMSAVLYYGAFFMISVKLYSPVLAGISILAFTLVVVPVSGITGAVIAKTGHYRWAILTGWVMSTLGCGVLIKLSPYTYAAAWVFMFLCAGVGQGMIMTGQLVAVQATCETRDIAYASSMYSFFRSVGLTFGVALGGTIFQNLLRRRVHDMGLSVDIAENAVGYATFLHDMADHDLRTRIVEAYAWAFQRQFAALTGISALGMVLSLGISSESLDKQMTSEHRLLTKVMDTKNTDTTAV